MKIKPAEVAYGLACPSQRGERVYLAMASRGYDGHMPHQNGDAAPVSQWATALAIPLAAWTIVAIAWSTL